MITYNIHTEVIEKKQNNIDRKYQRKICRRNEYSLERSMTKHKLGV